MKGLSVRAPWWWAILHGKPVENRDWYTSQRGRIWLHASKWWNQGQVENDLEDVEYMAEEDGLVLPPPQLGSMKALGGNLVGTVEIIDCVKDHPSAFFVDNSALCCVTRNLSSIRSPSRARWDSSTSLMTF